MREDQIDKYISMVSNALDEGKSREHIYAVTLRGVSVHDAFIIYIAGRLLRKWRYS